MSEDINIAIEYNERGVMIHLVDMPGAFCRGETIDIALAKVSAEVKSYNNWLKKKTTNTVNINIVQEEVTDAHLDDGDSEILTIVEKNQDKYWLNQLKYLAVKSATDFIELYESIPDKNYKDLSKDRTTFYGRVPSTAIEMLKHVDEVKEYYLSRVGITNIQWDNRYIDDRIKCIELLNKRYSDMGNCISKLDNELWNIHKVMRRFIWHDRIHAKALYRFAVGKWGSSQIGNPYKFNL